MGFDRLGSGPRERLLRRIAGGGAATALLCLGLVATLTTCGGHRDLRPLVLAVVVAGAACTALSWPLEARLPTRAPLLRYVLLGALTAAGVASVWTPGDYLVIALVVAVPLGAGGGAS